MIKIKVPATTANIGCGFDTLGCALTLYSTFTFDKNESFKITGCPEKYQNVENLVITSYKKVFNQFNKEIIPVSLHIDSEIPVSRGLGSSASCIVAGIWAANHFLGYPLNKEQCLDIATEIEGHPDNVAPAIYGNLCSSFMSDQVYTAHFNVSQDLNLLVMIPDFEVSTASARKVLPKTVDYKDAIFNVSRVACLCKALEENNQDMIHHALQDKLHEPYRKELIHEYEDIKEICKDEVAFFISGSGPTLICIAKNDRNEIIEKVSKLKCNWKCLLLNIDTLGVQEEIYD